MTIHHNINLPLFSSQILNTKHRWKSVFHFPSPEAPIWQVRLQGPMSQMSPQSSHIPSSLFALNKREVLSLVVSCVCQPRGGEGKRMGRKGLSEGLFVRLSLSLKSAALPLRRCGKMNAEYSSENVIF